MRVCIRPVARRAVPGRAWRGFQISCTDSAPARHHCCRWATATSRHSDSERAPTPSGSVLMRCSTASISSSSTMRSMQSVAQGLGFTQIMSPMASIAPPRWFVARRHRRKVQRHNRWSKVSVGVRQCVLAFFVAFAAGRIYAAAESSDPSPSIQRIFSAPSLWWIAGSSPAPFSWLSSAGGIGIGFGFSGAQQRVGLDGFGDLGFHSMLTAATTDRQLWRQGRLCPSLSWRAVSPYRPGYMRKLSPRYTRRTSGCRAVHPASLGPYAHRSGCRPDHRSSVSHARCGR